VVIYLWIVWKDLKVDMTWPSLRVNQTVGDLDLWTLELLLGDFLLLESIFSFCLTGVLRLDWFFKGVLWLEWVFCLCGLSDDLECDKHDRSLNSEKSSPQKEKQNQSLESDHFETSYSSEMGNRSFGGNLSMDRNPTHGKVHSIQHYVIKFVINLQQVCGLLQVLRFLHH
jgi:hypothetical protein